MGLEQRIERPRMGRRTRKSGAHNNKSARLLAADGELKIIPDSPNADFTTRAV